MDEKEQEVVRHKHTHRFEIGGNLTYIIGLIVIVGALFAMSYFHLWSQIK